MKRFIFIILIFIPASVFSEEKLNVGVVTVLSGDLSVLGDNAQKTYEVYRDLYPDPRVKVQFEDAMVSSTDGYRAYQKLINYENVDIIIAVCTSNATMAALSLFNGKKVPVISVSTGGENIDGASEFLFRIGNSDILNGIQQSEHFLSKNITKLSVITEQTEYTEDITEHFLKHFKANGGNVLTYDEFLPGAVDFKSIILKMIRKNPQAVFIPTQTGTALGLFLRQWSQLFPSSNAEIHTTFVAGPNMHAHKIAGPLIVGVYYMEPLYSHENARRKRLFEAFKERFGHEPVVGFHSAGFADSLDLISMYLDTHDSFDEKNFRDFLHGVNDYDGMLGKIDLDEQGNSSIGFRIKRIDQSLIEEGKN